MMGTTVTTRVPDDLSREIMEFAKEEKVNRSTEVRKLLAKAVRLKKIEHALEKYRKKEITIGRAAEIAGMPLREMIATSAKEEINFQYSLSDLREDFKEARK